MKTYGVVEIQLHATSALDGGDWLASRPGRFTPRERAPDSRWIGGWMDPRTGLDGEAKRKIPIPYRESYPGRPACSLGTMLTELSRFLQGEEKNYYLSSN
jgi:hypothetical protein